MFLDCQVARLLFGAAPRILPALWWSGLVLSAILLPVCVVAQETAASNPCAKCHADLVKGFAENPHGKAAAAHEGREVTCESCHAGSKMHIDTNGNPAKTANPAKLPTKDADALCLACHAGEHPNFAHSAHAAADVGCVNCHSIHHGKEGRLLKAAQPALCYQCHAGTESEFAAPVHHKADDGPVKCTACHDPHAILQSQLQAGLSQQVSACFKCHTELAGPWVYEHKSIKQAGCTACHTPHGGSNPKLLTQAKVNTICLQCHLPSATADDPEVSVAHTPASTRLCTSCHVAVHGSNHENRFTNP